MHKVMLAAFAGELWLLPLVFAIGGCSRDAAPPQFDPMSEQDVTRIVEDAIVSTMGDPDQTAQQRRLALEASRYDQADLQIKTMHKIFKLWNDFEKEHPRHWYGRIGFDEISGSSDPVVRRMNISGLRMSAQGALQLACPVSSAAADRQSAFLDDDASVQQIAISYTLIDRDVAACMENRRTSIKSLKAT